MVANVINRNLAAKMQISWDRVNKKLKSYINSVNSLPFILDIQDFK